MKVKAATTYYARMRGLIGTSQHQLDFDALHLIPCKGVHTYGMKYPLDLAFIDRQGKVIALKRSVPPNKVCSSPKGTQSVLERPASIRPWLDIGDYIASKIAGEDILLDCKFAQSQALKKI